MRFSRRGWLLGITAAGALVLSPPVLAQHRHGGPGQSHGGHGGGHSGHSFSHHRGGHSHGHHGGFSHGRRHLGHHGYRGHRRHHHHGRSFFFYPYYSAFYGSFYPGYGYWGYYPGYGYSYGGYGYDRGYVAGGSIAIEVQSALAELGYYRGAIDGVIGNGTRNAIRRFQRDNGLPITGRLDARLLGTLRVG